MQQNCGQKSTSTVGKLTIKPKQLNKSLYLLFARPFCLALVTSGEAATTVYFMPFKRSLARVYILT